jgi:hypothetical protein
MSGEAGFATRAATMPLGHRAGAGPDSIYVHAVAAKSVAGGPVALCGYPLREATLRPADGGGGTFEELARASADCCPECLAALAPGGTAREAARGRARSRAWVKWVAISVAMVTSLGGLAGVAIAVAQRF